MGDRSWRERPGGNDEDALERVHAELRELGTRRGFRRLERLIHGGDESDEVLLIETGVVKVILRNESGSELILGFYGSGELIGEIGVLNGGPRTASVTAHTNGSAVHIPGSRFRSFLTSHNTALFLVVGTLQERLRNADRWRLDHASLDVPTRVARQLLVWARTCGQTTERGITIRGLSQKDLAQSIAASERTVEQALRLLREARLVSTGRGMFVLPSPSGLERRSDGPGWRPNR